jgi:Protein of unknown function (DUF1275)
MRDHPRLAALVEVAGPVAPAHLTDRLARTARARWPWAGSGHGRLPALLVGLTVVTGLVDAVSYLALGHVFVANMTGNVVFLGFALAGAPGLSAPASLAALGAFLLGAFAGGRMAVRYGEQRDRHLRTATTIAALLVLLATLLAATFGDPVADSARYALIVPLAIAMGIQKRDRATTRRPGPHHHRSHPDAHRDRRRLRARRRNRRPSGAAPYRGHGHVHRRPRRCRARDQNRPRPPARDRGSADRRYRARCGGTRSRGRPLFDVEIVLTDRLLKG